MQKIFKVAGGIALAFGLLFMLFTFRVTYIEQGKTGLEISKIGDNKGAVDPLTPGWYFYNDMYTTIIETPNHVINYPFTAGSTEGSEANEEFCITTKDNMAVTFDAAIDCYVPFNKASTNYKKYRIDFDVLIKTIYRNYMRNIFNQYAANLTYDDLSSNLNGFRADTKKAIVSKLGNDGVVVEEVSFLSEMRPPDGLRNAILEKIKASQTSATKQQELVGVRADSAKKITAARAYALENALYQKSLTPQILELKRIEAWEKGGSKVPVYFVEGSGNGQRPVFLSFGK